MSNCLSACKECLNAFKTVTSEMSNWECKWRCTFIPKTTNSHLFQVQHNFAGGKFHGTRVFFYKIVYFEQTTIFSCSLSSVTLYSHLYSTLHKYTEAKRDAKSASYAPASKWNLYYNVQYTFQSVALFCCYLWWFFFVYITTYSSSIRN